MCSYYIIVSLQWSASNSFENLVQRRKKKAKKKSKQKKKRRRKEKGKRKGRGQGRNCLAGYNSIKKAVTSFPKLHFVPMQCCCILLAKQKGKPSPDDAEVSILQWPPLRRPPDLPALAQVCRTSLHMLPFGFTQVPGSLACSLV